VEHHNLEGEASFFRRWQETVFLVHADHPMNLGMEHEPLLWSGGLRLALGSLFHSRSFDEDYLASTFDKS